MRNANKITFETAKSINIEQSIIIGRLTVGEQEYSATYLVSSDGSCTLSGRPADTDDLPDGMAWPKPPAEYVRQAQELTTDWEAGD
jgi:hypothetical protein